MHDKFKAPVRNSFRFLLTLPGVRFLRTLNSTRLTLLYTAIMLCGLALPPESLRAEDPPRCGETEIVQSLHLTDWESGLETWTTGTYGVERPDTFDTPDWAVTANLPDTRPGNAAFVPNLDIGDCGADDESGVLTLSSPSIVIPNSAAHPRISFNHWYQIEYGWDGGNVKISVNGGPYTLVPATAFETGPYSNTLFMAFDEYGVTYNTNPLAEQDAFTGPEDEQTSSEWTESRVNLEGIAAAGDSIRLRFDFGVDACFGVVGWYLDEVEVYNCTEEPPPADTTLTLTNQAINDNGGTAVPSNWTLTASGPTGFSGPGSSVTSGAGFEPGTYNLAASGGPGGYANSAWSCTGATQVDGDTISLAEGQIATCTITNDDVPPVLTLVKQVVNDSGGTATAADWTLLASGPTGFSSQGPSVTSDAAFDAGRYDLDENGGPAGYAASAWDCDGGTQIDSNTVRLALAEQVTCTITNNDIAEGFQINTGHAGAWFNPDTSGQGQFIDIEPATQFMFISWFTYTDENSANPHEQRWLTAQGNYSGNLAELTLYETLGGRFDDPQEVETQPVGVVSLLFSDCEQGEMSYRIDTEGLEGGFPLVRVIPGSGNTCAEIDGINTQAVDINAGMDGSWFDPNTSGQGFFIDAYPDPEGGNFIFVSWFTYGDDTASGQRWLTAQGTFQGSVAEIDVHETTGGSFDDPLSPSTVKVGTLTLDFTDCSNAMLSYSLTDEALAGEIAVTRVVPGSEAMCEQLIGAE